MQIAIIVAAIGIVFCAIAGISFKVRAIANKPAWGGITLKSAVLGVILLLTGLAVVIIKGMARGQFQ